MTSQPKSTAATFRPNRRGIYRRMAIVAAAIYGPPILAVMFVAISFMVKGILYPPPPPESHDPTEWPDPIQTVHRKLIAGQSAMTMQGYFPYNDFEHRQTTDNAIFLIREATPEAMNFLTQELNLSQYPGLEQPIYFYRESALWASRDKGPIETFVSQGVLDGDEGHLYAIVYETGTKTIYIEYHFNF
jgi:hypothetical protein